MGKTYTFHTDPGHGWLQVNRSELVRLGIADQVSNFSYERGGVVYLEEDCDASLFIKAKRDAGEPVELSDLHTNSDHWIRNLQSYEDNVVTRETIMGILGS